MADKQSTSKTPDNISPQKIKHLELGEEANKKTAGLALSGGGIRSASFAMGVVQAFLRAAEHKQIKSFDQSFNYLSTVSGGGYFGGSLSWLRYLDEQAQKNDNNDNYGLKKQLDSSYEGARNREPENNWLDYVRQHGNYLKPSSISSLALLSVFLRNIITAFIVYFSILVVVFYGAIHSGILKSSVRNTLTYDISSLFSFGIIAYFSLLIVYAVATFIGSFGHSEKKHKTQIGKNKLTSIKFIRQLLSLLWTLLTVLLFYFSLNNFDALTSGGSQKANNHLSVNNEQPWVKSQVPKAHIHDTNTQLQSQQIIENFDQEKNQPKQQVKPELLRQHVIVFFACLILFSFSLMIHILKFNTDDNIPKINYHIRLMMQKKAGLLLGFMIMMGLVASIPHIYVFIGNQFATAISVSSAVGGVGLLGAIYQFFKGRSASVINNISGNLRIILSSAFLIFGLLIGAYSVVQQYHGTLYDGVIYVVIGVVLIMGLLINLNYFGIIRMYRDRLMETFLPDKESLKKGNWQPAYQADSTPLYALKDVRPYHIVNANVVLVDSEQDRYRGRGGDSFIIAPKYCGSEATGYIKTNLWLNNKMNLPTAIAISGAALNPNSGVSGRGISKNRLVSFLLAFMQIRMGYWAVNPSHLGTTNDEDETQKKSGHSFKKFITTVFKPNYLFPGIKQGLMGRGLNSKAYWSELTDGGHFDNTGVYELIRRQVDLIVLSMASADPDYNFSDLANLIQKVRVDFGVIIEFNDALDDIIPSKHKNQPNDQHNQDKHYLSAKIKYDDNKTGTLVVIATTSAIDMQPELESYKKEHPLFPHESTSDQFYDEQQLEAYRELGFLLASKTLKDTQLFQTIKHQSR